MPEPPLEGCHTRLVATLYHACVVAWQPVAWGRMRSNAARSSAQSRPRIARACPRHQGPLLWPSKGPTSRATGAATAILKPHVIAAPSCPQSPPLLLPSVSSCMPNDASVKDKGPEMSGRSQCASATPCVAESNAKSVPRRHKENASGRALPVDVQSHAIEPHINSAGSSFCEANMHAISACRQRATAASAAAPEPYQACKVCVPSFPARLELEWEA